MNRRTLRATGIVLTGMLLAGDPVSMIYAAPVAGVSVATTAEAVAVGTEAAARAQAFRLQWQIVWSQAMRKWQQEAAAAAGTGKQRMRRRW